MTKSVRQHRVVVSLTTMPGRIAGLKRVIPSLLNQTRPPDEIILNLPMRCARTDDEYVIPNWLAGQVTINRVERDYGPATKLLPTLELERDPETRIITVDDDILYFEKSIEKLLEVKDEGVVGLMGTITNIIKGNHFVHSENCPVGGHGVDLLGGYRGICYRRGLIEDDIFDDFDAICELMGGLLLDDDSFFSNYFSKKKVIKRVSGGLPRSHNGEYGFLNFRQLDVPDGMGIFVDSGGRVRRDFENQSEAMFRHFFPDDYERDRNSVGYHIRGDHHYHGRGICNKDETRALEVWLEGAHKGNRQCLQNVLWALKNGVCLERKSSEES